MSRGIPGVVKDAFLTDGFHLATLIKMYRGGRQLLITDYHSNLVNTYDSLTYQTSSHILEIGGTSESQELRVNDMILTLSGADREFISSFLNNSNFTADTVTIFRAAIDPDNDTVKGAFVMFEGRISEYAIQEDETESTVQVTITSHWADFEKVNGRKTNSNSQQIYFKNDKGFEFASKTVKDLRWGRAS